jgi:hypothetical protein
MHSTRSAIRRIAAVLGVMVLCSAACSNPPDRATLTGPTDFQPPGPTIPGPVATGPSLAVLEMSDVSITLGGDADEPGALYLNEKFKLTETGGKSGATIQHIWSSVEGGETFGTGHQCWRTPIRVAPGSTTDAFDARADDLVYCAPFAVGRVPATVRIHVSFADDDGRFGSVETTTVVTR